MLHSHLPSLLGFHCFRHLPRDSLIGLILQLFQGVFIFLFGVACFHSAFFPLKLGGIEVR